MNLLDNVLYFIINFWNDFFSNLKDPIILVKNYLKNGNNYQLFPAITIIILINHFRKNKVYFNFVILQYYLLVGIGSLSSDPASNSTLLLILSSKNAN